MSFEILKLFSPLIVKVAIPKEIDSKMHTVYPFTDAPEERRSVSFNVKIDDDAAKPR